MGGLSLQTSTSKRDASQPPQTRVKRVRVPRSDLAPHELDVKSKMFPHCALFLQQRNTESYSQLTLQQRLGGPLLPPSRLQILIEISAPQIFCFCEPNRFNSLALIPSPFCFAQKNNCNVSVCFSTVSFPIHLHPFEFYTYYGVKRSGRGDPGDLPTKAQVQVVSMFFFVSEG